MAEAGVAWVWKWIHDLNIRRWRGESRGCAIYMMRKSMCEGDRDAMLCVLASLVEP